MAIDLGNGKKTQEQLVIDVDCYAHHNRNRSRSSFVLKIWHGLL